jgi:lipopolysaccharide/colanic/teichoic acid biosynthesis glycosyltransferase
MGLIWGIVLSVLGVAGAILIPVTARVVGDDAKEWLPWITRHLVERAVSRLPEQERSRFEEEWWAHINELPGNLAKVYSAWGCLSASKAMSHIALSGDTTRIEVATRRATDIAVAVSCLVFTLPLMLLIALCIKLDSPGPVFFKQKRLGANNTPFDLLKFRSMYVEQTDPLGYRLTGDGDNPRITRVGRFLRYFCLDELPQLLNVLTGELSLVGPRPVPPTGAADAFAKSETPNLRCLRPGITGWTQINGWEGKTETDGDLYYLQNRSLGFDCFILLRTVLLFLPRESTWKPRTSLGFFWYFCVCMIGLMLAITCLIGLVLAIPL